MLSIIKRVLKKGEKRRQAVPHYQNIEALMEHSLSKPFSFSIDILDGCNLRCVHCPRGIYFQQNTFNRMTVADFTQLLNDIMLKTQCQKIELYNWSEPFLHTELDQLLHVVKGHQLECILSSNLSFQNDVLLESVLLYSPTLLVSVSGFTQESHERYHQGSHIEQIKRNLQYIAEFKKTNKAQHTLTVEIRCLEFVDNQQDQKLWKEYCHQHGFIYRSLLAYASEVTTIQTAKRLIFPPEFEEHQGTMIITRHFSRTPILTECPLHNTIPVNAFHDVYLCCIYWNREEYKIGNIFEMTIADIQRKRLSHHDCSHCTAFRKQL